MLDLEADSEKTAIYLNYKKESFYIVELRNYRRCDIYNFYKSFFFFFLSKIWIEFTEYSRTTYVKMNWKV